MRKVNIKPNFILIGLSVVFCSINCMAGTAEQMEDAENYFKCGKYEQAETIYKIIEANGLGNDTGLEIQKRLIILYEDWGKQEDADTALSKIIKDFSVNPKSTLAVCDIAVYYSNLKQYELAKKYYQNVAYNWPKDEQSVWSLFAIIKINITEGNDIGVQAAYKKIVDNYSNHQNAAEMAYEIAENYRSMGKNEVALSYYKDVADNWPKKDFAVFCQMYVVTINFTMGKDEEAKLALKKLLMDYSDNERLATALWEVSQCCKNLNKFEKLDEFYQYALDTAGQGEFTLWPLVGKAVSNINLDNDKAVQTIINKLLSNYESHPYLGKALSLIAEEYYLKGKLLQKNNQEEKANEYFKCAGDIWSLLMDKLPPSRETIQVCNWVADYYRDNGRHKESIEFYKKILDKYPDYKMGWHCLFMIGREFEAMKEAGTISETEADSKIKAAYEQLLEKYPDSKPAKAAKAWLNQQKHNDQERN